MGKPVVGDVVVLPFPFSDLSQTRRRPALVLANLAGDDLILCMVTSQDVRDQYAISLDESDFTSGRLPVASNIRPSRLLTVDSALVEHVAGHVSKPKMAEVREALRALFSIPATGRPV